MELPQPAQQLVSHRSFYKNFLEFLDESIACTAEISEKLKPHLTMEMRLCQTDQNDANFLADTFINLFVFQAKKEHATTSSVMSLRRVFRSFEKFLESVNYKISTEFKVEFDTLYRELSIQDQLIDVSAISSTASYVLKKFEFI